MFAIELNVSLGSTPLALLAAVLLLTLVGAAVLVGLTLALPRFVDKRWPATQPLNPRELMWAEMRGAVERTFVGLDLELARALVDEMEEMHVRAGMSIFEQGDPATHFYLIKTGEVEVRQRIEVEGLVAEQVIRHLGTGAFFGEVAIMRRTPRTASVRALVDCVLMTLPAREFLSGAARSAADEHLLLRTVDKYLADDRRRAAVLAESVRSRRSS